MEVNLHSYFLVNMQLALSRKTSRGGSHPPNIPMYKLSIELSLRKSNVALCVLRLKLGLQLSRQFAKYLDMHMSNVLNTIVCKVFNNFWDQLGCHRHLIITCQAQRF